MLYCRSLERNGELARGVEVVNNIIKKHMIQLTQNGFVRSFDVDQMMYDDMVWLSNKINLPVGEFEIFAKQIELTQENWARFWSMIRSCKIQEPVKISVVNGKKRTFTNEEFEVAKQILGTPQRVSECCSAPIDSEGLCSDCGSHCSDLYLFS